MGGGIWEQTLSLIVRSESLRSTEVAGCARWGNVKVGRRECGVGQELLQLDDMLQTRCGHGSLEGVGGLKTNEAYHSKADAMLIPEM